MNYAYTAVGELSTITDSAGQPLATYSYNDQGSRTGLSRPNATLTSYVADGLQRLQQLTQNLSGTSLDLTKTFTYNPAGQIASETLSNDAAYSWAPSSPISTTTAQFNGANQLKMLGSSTVLSDPRGNVSSGIDNRSYTFDLLGQLRGSTGGTGTVSVDYDPSGMLRRTVGPLGTVQYLYDGPDLIAQYDGSGNLLRRYVHGAGMDEPLVWYEGSQTSARKYLHADERGTAALTASTDIRGWVAISLRST